MRLPPPWLLLPPTGYYKRKSRSGAHIYLLVMLMAVVASTAAAPDVEALLELKDEWKATLPTWISSTDPCTAWEGVTCNSQGELIALNLEQKGLSGAVPSVIGKLVSLTALDLANNRSLSGPWNNVLGDLSALAPLKNLQFLNLSFNILQSEFPSVVLQLTKLVDLRLDNTFMRGPFPTGLSNLVNLQYLYLGNCTMEGAFPAEIGKLTNLRELTLWNNQFDSKLPVELSDLSNLTYMNLHGCNLWGALPPEFRKLVNMKTLHLYDNKFTGTVPDQWQNMKKLEELRLNENFLTGTFPSWILQHSSLSVIYLSYNQMYGPIPDLTASNFSLARLECDFFNGTAPVAPPQTRLYAEGNCYSNVTAANDNSVHTCGRSLGCAAFLQDLLQDNCPPCPTDQTRLSSASCVCEKDQVENGSKGKLIALIAGPLVAVVLLILITIIILRKLKNRRKKKFLSYGSIPKDELRNVKWDVPEGVKKYTLQDLIKATNDFNKDYEIGAGGFGKVFYGILDNEQKVAIKRASPSSVQGIAEFRNEILLLSRLHHRNLVRLLGFCEDDGLQILVYEFMINGNLHNCLFRNDLLSWYKRLEIMLGIAQGLEYLHLFADPPVIHRDIKPSNILLDENLVPKLADFGLSKATLEFETHVSTRPAGTAGYMDPEYFLRRQLTTASDVYSFGVVLLELVTGQKAIDQNREEDENLVEWAKLKMKTDGIGRIIDPRIKSFYPEDIYEEITQFAIKCASYKRDDRPSIQELVGLLEARIHALPCSPTATSTASALPEDANKKGTTEVASSPTRVQASASNLTEKSEYMAVEESVVFAR